MNIKASKKSFTNLFLIAWVMLTVLKLISDLFLYGSKSKMSALLKNTEIQNPTAYISIEHLQFQIDYFELILGVKLLLFLAVLAGSSLLILTFFKRLHLSSNFLLKTRIPIIILYLTSGFLNIYPFVTNLTLIFLILYVVVIETPVLFWVKSKTFQIGLYKYEQKRKL